MATIAGYWVIHAENRADRDIGDGAPLETYYGSDAEDRVATPAGLVIRCSQAEAEARARQFAANWYGSSEAEPYTVAALDDRDHFGAYQRRVEELLARGG